MAYQSAVIAFTQCEAAGDILIRLYGVASKGRGALKNRFLSQRAKVGFCPCRVVATHVAVIANYA